MYIKKLELLNFQVIEKFTAEFNGNIYFITGENEVGKSTLLKAIGALLTGERDDVLRNGASKGFAKMVVGGDGEEYDVQLSFSETNPRGTLTIKNTTTGMKSDNVSLLERIFGYRDFDAVDFSRWSETAGGRRKQIELVKSLLAPNVRERIDAIDAEVTALKGERIGINRDVKTFDTLLSQILAKLEPGDIEKYASPIDTKQLWEQQQTNAALIAKAKGVRETLAIRNKRLQEIPGEMDAAKARYEQAVNAARAEYEKSVAALSDERADVENRKKNCEDWLAKYEANNPEKTDVETLLKEAEAHNKKFSLVEQYREKKAQYEEVSRKAQNIEDTLGKLAAERQYHITAAALPVDGLTFTDDGLELNGVPFVPGKVSDSQIMEVAAKLIIAANPNVKVFRIARGESLGVKRLQAIIDIAKRNGYQGFIEQVQRGQAEMVIEEYEEK